MYDQKKYKYPLTGLLVDTMNECGYTPWQMSRYLNVPTPTLMNWISERREAPPMAEKLVEVLMFLRRFAPDIHAHFEPPQPPPDLRRKEFKALRVPTPRPKRGAHSGVRH